jgi:hypothetical protein
MHISKRQNLTPSESFFGNFYAAAIVNPGQEALCYLLSFVIIVNTNIQC